MISFVIILLAESPDPSPILVPMTSSTPTGPSSNEAAVIGAAASLPVEPTENSSIFTQKSITYPLASNSAVRTPELSECRPASPSTSESVKDMEIAPNRPSEPRRSREKSVSAMQNVACTSTRPAVEEDAVGKGVSKIEIDLSDR